MDFETLKRRQSLKVIISEAVMVIAVVIMVVVLGFIVSGYWLNADFTIERQGLLQVSSAPTGADVTIDGNTLWLQKTNTSKILSSGEHEVALTKEGYDSWSKTINISEGLLYRLNYPRLFLTERTTESVLDATNVVAATISPNRETILLINSTTTWSLVNLNSDTLEPKPIVVTDYFPEGFLPSNSTISSANWDHDGSHILFKVSTAAAKEWVLLDVKNPANSINLTKTFGHDFEDIKIINNSASLLLAVHGGNLHKIDLSNRSISSILIQHIQSFDYRDNEIAFSAYDETKEQYNYGIFNLGSNDTTIIKSSPNTASMLISKFYDDTFITILINNEVFVYKKDNLAVFQLFELSFIPKYSKVGHNGEYLIFSHNNKIASIDMESMLLSEWQVKGNTFGWADGSMIYSVADGELTIYDYDGLNQRVLAQNVSADLPVTITNNKWLYYFSDHELVREWLIPR